MSKRHKLTRDKTRRKLPAQNALRNVAGRSSQNALRNEADRSSQNALRNEADRSQAGGLGGGSLVVVQFMFQALAQISTTIACLQLLFACTRCCK